MTKDADAQPYFLGSRSLREACQMLGWDDAGRRCRECPLRELCEDESRWLVRRAQEERAMLT
jgi:hypothetical protein